MANQWLRLWHDMPTDPKWRTIAKASGQRIGDVMAVYVHLLVTASNAIERGRTHSFNSEDVASALDLETEQVNAIVDAMQGRVLEGDKVRGWDRRQVAREDGSAERAKAWRQEQKAKKPDDANAPERNRTPDKDKEEIKNIEETPPSRSAKTAGSRLDVNWVLPPEWQEWAEKERPDLDIGTTAYGFRDFWIAKPGKDGRKADWQATWRNWVRNQRQGSGRSAKPESYV